MATATKRPPVEEMRVGTLKAVIWQNDTDNGVRYSVNLVRLYKKNDGNWGESHSLGRDDLLGASRLLEQAYDRIHELQQSHS